MFLLTPMLLDSFVIVKQKKKHLNTAFFGRKNLSDLAAFPKYKRIKLAGRIFYFQAAIRKVIVR